jgi:HB1, ASXL, restriction endonuclease HTH domain
MHTNSNPQEPTTAAPDLIAPDSAATATATPATPAEQKQATTKKPAAKNPTGGRPTTKPDTKGSRPPKAARKAPDEAPTPAAGSGPREGSTTWAILQVLGDATQPLSAKDIYAEIANRKLAPGLKGKTPDQSVAATLAVAAKRGQYVKRAAPGKFQLLQEKS